MPELTFQLTSPPRLITSFVQPSVIMCTTTMALTSQDLLLMIHFGNNIGSVSYNYTPSVTLSHQAELAAASCPSLLGNFGASGKVIGIQNAHSSSSLPSCNRRQEFAAPKISVFASPSGWIFGSKATTKP